MYNAGTNKVRKNNTPQTTLNYISQIQSYRSELDANFASEVLAMYNEDNEPVESCPHSKQTIYVNLSVKPEAYDIMRVTSQA